MDEVKRKKKNRQYLTNDEKWAIYKFCIENHCLSQNGEAFKFRVSPTIAADEMNSRSILERKITSYHINNSILDVVEWEKKFNKLPEPQETAELEQIRIQHNKDINEIEKLKLVIENLQKQVNKNEGYEEANKRLVEKLSKIKLIANL